MNNNPENEILQFHRSVQQLNAKWNDELILEIGYLSYVFGHFQPDFKIWTEERDLPGDSIKTAQIRAAREGREIAEYVRDWAAKYQIEFVIPVPLLVNDIIPDVSIFIDKLSNEEKIAVCNKIQYLQKSYKFKLSTRSIAFQRPKELAKALEKIQDWEQAVSLVEENRLR
jgi:hypothetical protein